MILGASIASLLQPLQKGSVAFHFAPDDGGTNIAGGTGGNQAGGGGSSSGEGGNQQQQQQQAAPVDPFAGIDLDLVDEGTRNAIVAARQQLATANQTAAQARDWQSKHDKLAADIARQQQQGNQNQQQQQQRQQQQAEPSFEQELEQTYLEQGFNAEQSRSMAKVQAAVLGKFAARTEKFVSGQTQPMAGTLAMTNATMMFQQLQQNDQTARYFSVPEVNQQVWERVQANIAQGVDMTPGAVVGLAKILMVDHLESQQGNGGGPITLPFAPPPPPVNNGNQQQNTRFTFPGAGHSVVRPNVRPKAPVDPETDAAVKSTIAAMRQWQPKGGGITGIVTRGQ